MNFLNRSFKVRFFRSRFVFKAGCRSRPVVGSGLRVRPSREDRDVEASSSVTTSIAQLGWLSPVDQF